MYYPSNTKKMMASLFVALSLIISVHAMENPNQAYTIRNIPIKRLSYTDQTLPEISSEDTVGMFYEKVTELMNVSTANYYFLLNGELLIKHKKMGVYFPKDQKSPSPVYMVERLGRKRVPKKNMGPIFLLNNEECGKLLEKMPMNTCIFWKNLENNSLQVTLKTNTHCYLDNLEMEISDFSNEKKLEEQLRSCVAYEPTTCIDRQDAPKLPSLNDFALSLCRKNIKTYSPEEQAYIDSLDFTTHKKEEDTISL